MSLVINSCDATSGGYTTIIQRPDNGVTGLRVLSEPFSTLAVWAFPFSAIPQAARLDGLQKPGPYLLCNTREAETYVGETGNLANRLLDHLKHPTKQFATEVFGITSKDDSFSKRHAEFGQSYLYEAAEKAGLVTLVNDVRPHRVELEPHEVGPLVRKLSDVQRPLFDGGCRALHDCNPTALSMAGVVETEGTAPNALEEEGDDDCGEMLIGLTTVPLGVEESELKYLRHLG